MKPLLPRSKGKGSLIPIPKRGYSCHTVRSIFLNAILDRATYCDAPGTSITPLNFVTGQLWYVYIWSKQYLLPLKPLLLLLPLPLLLLLPLPLLLPLLVLTTTSTPPLTYHNPYSSPSLLLPLVVGRGTVGGVRGGVGVIVLLFPTPTPPLTYHYPYCSPYLLLRAIVGKGRSRGREE